MHAAERDDTDPVPISIVQITDSHLFEDPATTLVGVNCQESFEDVLALIRRERRRIDCIVCTGDIAQDASVAAYRRFIAALSAFDVPWYCIPGNHDLPHNLELALDGDLRSLTKSVVIGAWQIILLDSSVRGKVHGVLDEAELSFLESQLAESRSHGLHAFVCVHHNPLPVRASWLQRHALQNSEAFLAVLDRHPHVRGVLWGHIHQEFDGERAGVRMLASPSTCVQFHPDNDEFTVDARNPGYRWLELHPDGRIDSGVSRVTDKSFDVDFSSPGY